MVSPHNPTKYRGTMVNLANIVVRNRRPTGADIRQPETGKYYSIFAGWQVGKNPTDGVEGELWLLSKIVANVAYWIQVTPEVDSLLSLSDTADVKVYPDTDGNIKLDGGTGINVDAVPLSHEHVISTSALLTVHTQNGSVVFDEGNGVTFTGSNNISVTGSGSTVTTALTAGSSISSFFAFVNANVLTVTGDGTGYTITCNSTSTNTGSNYSTSTGKYTAPATGIYQFNTSIAISNIGAGHTTGRFFITIKNAGGTTLNSYEFAQFSPAACQNSDNNLSVSGSIVVSMAATDTAQIGVTVNGSTKTITLNGSNTTVSSPFTAFSGTQLA